MLNFVVMGRQSLVTPIDWKRFQTKKNDVSKRLLESPILGDAY